MSTRPRSDDWILRSRALLDRDLAQCEPQLLQRLGVARRQALAAAATPARPRWLLFAGLGGGLAATAALLLALGLSPFSGPGSTAGGIQAVAPAQRASTPLEEALTLPAEDLELMARPDDYALLGELEFYAWLDGEGQDG